MTVNQSSDTQQTPEIAQSPDTQDFVRRIGGSHPVSDYALWSAGLTFFGLLAAVPFALVSISVAGRLLGPDRIRDGVAHMTEGFPDRHNVREGIVALADSALRLSWARQIGLLFPLSLYGEGLRRSFLQLSYGRPSNMTGWRGRIAVLPAVLAGPVLVGLIALLAPTVGPLYAAGGWRLLLGIAIAFHFTFVAIGGLLTFVYGHVGSASISRRATLIGAFGAASMIAGFAQGFLVFLAIPVDWAELFGGLSAVGTFTALALWLYAMHLLVLVGYRLALVTDETRRVRAETRGVSAERRW